MKKIKFLTWPLFIIIISVISGGIVLSFLEKKTSEDFFKEIMFTSNVCISAFDTDPIKGLSLMSSADISNNENYSKLKKQVLAMGNNFKDKGVDAIYILFQKEEKIYFLVESTPENDPLYIPPGELYQQPPAEVFASFKNSLSYFSDHYTDEYGSYLSNFTPIFDSSGQQVGVLGVDVDYKLYETTIQKLRFLFFSIWIAIVLFIIFLFLYFRNLKKMKQDSSLSEQKIKTITDSINDGIIVINNENEVVFLNKTSEIIFSHSSLNLLGSKFSDFIKIENAVNIISGEPILDFNLSVDAHKGNNIFEVSLKNNKKIIEYYELFSSLIKIGNDEYLVIIFHDISKRKARDEEIKEQKNSLEKFNNLMIGREIKMIELKKELLKLKDKS